MRLRDWLRTNGIRPVDLGRMLGLRDPKSVYRYLGVPPRRIPRPPMMDKIRTTTRGAVTAEDFYRPASMGETKRREPVVRRGVGVHLRTRGRAM